jgi:hypothetical protein
MTITQRQLNRAIEKHEVPIIASVFPLSNFSKGADGVIFLNRLGLAKMETQRKDRWTEKEALEWAIPE